MRPYDLEYLQRAIALSAQARERGNGPFGALLVDAAGNLLLEAENTVMSAQDCTGHAETNLIRKASALYPREVLAGCTLYTSTEPCAMCAGAIFWSGISRVVYAMPECWMGEMATNMAPGDFLNLPCREVFARGGRDIEVHGPLLEEEARKAHIGFW
ncbi:MAG TPA: nucleoside deaminase [Anaerolineaceae bacterium]